MGSAPSLPGLTGLRRNPELVPGLLAVAVFVAWAASEGGYVPDSLYPGALFMLGLLVATTFGFRWELGRLPRTTAIALALLAAFALWSFVAILWADDKAVAWDGANRSLLYLTIFALFALPRWRARNAATVLGIYSLGIAVLGAVLVLDLTRSGDPELSFINGRLSDPTGYQNATAALFASASWPALFLASRRETPWPARGLALAAAAFLIQLAVIPQSRGAFIVYPITVVLYFVVVPGRVRSALALLPVAAATALAGPILLDVFSASSAELPGALDDAAHAMALSAIALFVVGAALGLADRRLSVSDRVSLMAERGFGAAAALAAIVGVVVFVSALGSPVSWANDRWDDFKGGYDPQGFGTSRFSGDLGSNRYDFFRVAVSDEFASAPLEGDGTDNFAITYVRERSSDEAPLYPHSLPIQILAGTGVIGGALFAGFVAFAVTAALRVRSAGARFARATAAAALVAFAYSFLHACGDWVWAFAAVGGPAVAWLGLAGRIEAEAGPDRALADPRSSRSLRAPAITASVVGLLLVVFAAGSYLLPWAAARDVESAKSTWRSDPAGALDRLDRARHLNFLSAEPDTVAGSIAERLGDSSRMRTSFERALERQPESWLALLELGGLDAVQGRRSSALTRLRRARELNPLDPLIRLTLRRARVGDPLPLARINRTLVQRICQTVGRTHDTRFCH
jgi:hypothetical protein